MVQRNRTKCHNNTENSKTQTPVSHNPTCSFPSILYIYNIHTYIELRELLLGPQKILTAPSRVGTGLHGADT
uniref:Uncharacterized protein n=1 Tax=Octopus bimaculoides TaxID=37653 RepID=A0A0L8H977_OCTBM